MGSFSKKKKSSSKYDKLIASSLKPANFYTPYGNLIDGRYEQLDNPALQQARYTTDDKLTSVLNQIPTAFDVNTAYNSPFYQTIASLYQTPIRAQQDQDTRSLNNRLTALNQLGSSYDAYQRDLQNRRYDDLYKDSENRARLGSVDAYNQSIQQSLNTLNTLRNDKTAQMNQAFMPLQYALNYQNNSVPLQQSLANYYQNQAATQNNSSSNSFLSSFLSPNNIANAITAGVKIASMV